MKSESDLFEPAGEHPPAFDFDASPGTDAGYVMAGAASSSETETRWILLEILRAPRLAGLSPD